MTIKQIALTQAEQKQTEVKKMQVFGKYFYGNEISEYGQEHGYVDYRTLAKAFDAVMNNDIISNTQDIGYWEQVSGFVDNSEQIDDIKEKLIELQDELTDTDADADSKIQEQIDELEAEIDELEYEQDYYPEVFQFFIVSDRGADILQEFNEIVYYNESLDMYVWGVTHWGTSWDYVLTNIRCNTGEF